MPSALSSVSPVSAGTKLADFIEQHSHELIPLLVAALRGELAPAESAGTGELQTSWTGSPSAAAAPTMVAGASVEQAPSWSKVGVIDGFEAVWPAPKAWKAKGQNQLREHYGHMDIYETNDTSGVARLGIGQPDVRISVYGKERGWISVWEVVNGQPQRQLAIFYEVDDFDQTGDRAALISGKDGAAKRNFPPHERHLLAPIYASMRIEVQRDRIVGANSRNRLIVVANDDEVYTMLNHGLAHLKLRS